MVNPTLQLSALLYARLLTLNQLISKKIQIWTKSQPQNPVNLSYPPILR